MVHVVVLCWQTSGKEEVWAGQLHGLCCVIVMLGVGIHHRHDAKWISGGAVHLWRFWGCMICDLNTVNL